MFDFGLSRWLGVTTGAGFVISQLPLVVIAALLVGIVLLPFGVRLQKRIGTRRFAQTVLSALLTVAGTIPPVVVGLLWYARQVDYLWAVNGPVPFRFVGIDGAAWMSVFVWTVGASAACWGAAAWLNVRSHRPDGSGRRSRAAFFGGAGDGK